MEPVSILISNCNGLLALQLCIESIRKYTEYPHKIIVYDDMSNNNIDIKYLRECKAKGWIELIEGEKRIFHGGAINLLLNDFCKTDYAILMDDDIEIKDHGWLGELVPLVQEEKILGVGELFKITHHYCTDFYSAWFLFFDMKAYRDGMQVDWRPSYGDRREEPYKTFFADKPLPDNVENKYRVVNETGSKLHIKLASENPKGYKILPIPDTVKMKFGHWGSMSFGLGNVIRTKTMGKWLEKMAKINESLEKLRRQ